MGLSSPGERSLAFEAGAPNHQYTATSFPFSQSSDAHLKVTEVLTTTYYDTYGFIGDGTASLRPENTTPYPFGTDAYHLAATLQTTVKGQVTGTRTKVLGSSSDADGYLMSIAYYDNKYRLARSVAEHHLGGTDVTDTQYDFTGNVRRVHSAHTVGDATTGQLLEYGYDHAGRPTTCDHTLDGRTVRLYTNVYNELGELVTKQLHQGDGEDAHLRAVEYAYNIRGWLEGINKPSLDGGAQPPSPLFQMELIYNTELPNE